MKKNKLSTLLLITYVLASSFLTVNSQASEQEMKEGDLGARNKVIMKAKMRTYEETDSSGKTKKESTTTA